MIHRQSGAAKCREVLEYVVMALAKYLQITVAYDIFKGDLEKISGHLELFNEHLEALAVVFRLVTNTEFQQLNKISTLPTLQVIWQIAVLYLFVICEGDTSYQYREPMND